MKLAKLCHLPGMLLCALLFASCIHAQSVSTTTVQGTVYLANGAPASGTLQLSWPAFTTADNQAVSAGRFSVQIAADGFVSVNVAPNQGASPAGLFYTAIYHLSDGSTSTEYWTVPKAAQATIGEVRAQVMPAAQAVQAVNKTYVDQSIQELTQSLLTASGGNLTGPLYLNGDPAVPSQAANKHYVDNTFAQALPVTGGIAGGPLTATRLGGVYQADQSAGADFTTKLQACINGLDGTYGGTCDARNFPGALTLTAPLTIANPNVTVLLPCATISTSSAIVIAPGTRNVTLHGCATRGTSTASGSQGGTVFLSSGSAALFQVGDSNYSADTLGFHLDNVAINTTASNSASAQALAAWRTQELNLDSLYILGNADQTGITLDGTGNYAGGTFQNLQIGGYKTALNAIGHQTANSATTDWLNAATFLRLHINCPIFNGNPIAGTIGINLQQGDGNTFTGGDVEGCDTALHLGPNAQNNTIVGLRNENSNSQVIADAGSAYNNWITGGTMFTGKLTDNGTRNSFLDTFHRSFNALNGDWYGSQQDATLTNHFRLGIGSGSERGLLNRYQTDYGYRWTTGLSDASAGEQFYQVFDELNNVNRVSIGQYNSGQSSTNNQTALNSAGTGAIVLNGSNNAGTGGIVFGSGGTSSTTVATVDKSGNANFTGTMQVGSTAQSAGTMTVRNNADAEVDYYLWPGLTASQKGSFTYKDYNGASQWYLLKDASNNWALNSATGGIDSIKAYQSGNSGDTYVNAQKSSGVVRVNYEPGSGSAFNIYGGNSGSLYASFGGANAIKFPGLASANGANCMQIDNSGYLSNSGAPCGTGSGNVGTGILGQIAYYTANGAALGGVTAVPLASGGTGASDSTTALANLGALPASGGTLTGPLAGTSATFSATLAANQTVVGGAAAPAGMPAASALAPLHCTPAVTGPVPNSAPLNARCYGAVANDTSDQTAHLQAWINAATPSSAGTAGNARAYLPPGIYHACGLILPPSIDLEGDANRITYITATPGCTGDLVKDNGVNAAGITIRHIAFNGNGEAGLTSALNLGCQHDAAHSAVCSPGSITPLGSNSVIEDVQVINVPNGQCIKANGNEAIYDHIFTNACKGNIFTGTGNLITGLQTGAATGISTSAPYPCAVDDEGNNDVYDGNPEVEGPATGVIPYCGNHGVVKFDSPQISANNSVATTLPYLVFLAAGTGQSVAEHIQWINGGGFGSFTNAVACGATTYASITDCHLGVPSGQNLANGVTASTQPGTDNSTKVATTAFVANNFTPNNALTTYTPTAIGLTNSGGAPTVLGWYQTVGNMVFVWVEIEPVVTTSSTQGTTTVTLPIPPGTPGWGQVATTNSAATVTYTGGVIAGGYLYLPTWTNETRNLLVTAWYRK